MNPVKPPSQSFSFWGTLAKGGPVAVIAGMLLFIYATSLREVEAKQVEITQNMSTVMTQHEMIKGEFTRLKDALLLAAERQVRLLQVMCVNLARTEDARRTCLSI